MDIEDDNVSDLEQEVIMAIDLKGRNKLGCCYYDAREQIVRLLSQTEYTTTDVIDALKVYVQPTIVLISTRIHEDIESRLHEFPERGNEAQDNIVRLPYKIEARPPQEFNYGPAMSRLSSTVASMNKHVQMDMFVPGDEDMDPLRIDEHAIGFTERQGKMLRASSLIDTECQSSIGCAGALLTYIGRRRAVSDSSSRAGGHLTFPIADLEMFSLENTMFVNADTLTALNIVQPEFGPQSRSQRPSDDASASKEGLSVYGLFHHLARTPQGKQLLRQYFLRPSLDHNLIEERLQAVAVFLQEKNATALTAISKSLKSISNIRATLTNLRKGISGSSSGQISQNTWARIRWFAFHSLQIRDAAMNVDGAGQVAVIVKILTLFDPRGLARVGEQISDVVDFQSTAEMHRTVVRMGFDGELDHMKRTYDGIEDLLNRTSQVIASTVPSHHDLDLNVIFFPQIGFLISISLNPETGRPEYSGGITGEDRWDLIFSTQGQAYFKDSRMRELDDSLGDMYAMICDREIEIAHALGQRILLVEAMLNQTSEICGELDCLVAFTDGAKRYNLSRPTIVPQNVIDVKGGRHLLQERVVPSYVANDTYIVGRIGDEDQQLDAPPQGPNMLIMSGPNYSGKSIYLKQVAIIVYLSHIGCFVPATKAIIGLTDKILTRVATRETVAKAQSAFMIDLQQIALALRLATHRSLLLIDEFGKGTASNDGAGLFCGVFHHLLSLGERAPKVIGATHFHELFEQGLLRPSKDLAFGHMEVRLDEESEIIEDQVTHLYNLRQGWSSSSFGNNCAAINGIDTSVVSRSEELSSLLAQGRDLVAVCSEMSEAEKQDLVTAEEEARAFLERDFNEDENADEI